jgi:uncharacterized membrane protein YkvI
LYEIVIVVGLIIALSITTTVGGTVLGEHFGVDTWIGTIAVLFLVVTLTYQGLAIIEKSMMFSVISLFLVLVVLMVQLFQGFSDVVVAAFDTHPHQWTGLSTALTYAIGGGGYLPLLLYCARGLNTRAEVIVAALTAATIAALPALMFHLAFMSNYPAVINEKIPTYAMFEHVSTPLMLNIYVMVMFLLVAQTGVGILQGLIARVDSWHQQNRGRPLTPLGHGTLAGTALVVCMALGSMGITALILRGYTIMFASFIVVFVLPLMTYGLYLVYRSEGKDQSHALND